MQHDKCDRIINYNWANIWGSCTLEVASIVQQYQNEYLALSQTLGDGD